MWISTYYIGILIGIHHGGAENDIKKSSHPTNWPKTPVHPIAVAWHPHRLRRRSRFPPSSCRGAWWRSWNFRRHLPTPPCRRRTWTWVYSAQRLFNFKMTKKPLQFHRIKPHSHLHTVWCKSPWTVVWFSHIMYCLCDHRPEGRLMQCHWENMQKSTSWVD